MASMGTAYTEDIVIPVMELYYNDKADTTPTDITLICVLNDGPKIITSTISGGGDISM